MVDLRENLVPVTTNISSSASTCSRSGRPPFTVTITYECTIGATIWALYKHYAYWGNGSEIGDPRRIYRKRIGPSHRYLEDEADTEIDFTELVRLERGEILQKLYTFDVEDDRHKFFHNDVYNLLAGNEYQLGLRRQKWWWMFESEMPENSSMDEKKQILYDQPATEWQPQHRMTFRVTE